MSRLALLLVLSVAAFVCEAKIRSGAVRCGANPGIAVRLYRNGMDAFFKGVSSVSSRYAHKFPIPDTSCTFGGTDMQTKNIRITDFPPPETRFRFVPPNGLVASLKLPRLRFEGPFSAARRTFVSTDNDQGQLNFTANDITVNVSCTLGEFENGIPKIDQFDCASSLGQAGLKVSGTTKNFATDGMKVAAAGFRPGFTGLVCPTIKKLVGGQINQLLARIPNCIDVSKSISFKFQVKPTFGENYMEARLHGKTITNVVSPYTPVAFDVAPCDNADVVVLISDAVFNDALWQACTNDLLKVTISPNSQPILYDLCRLDCETANDACLGNVAPDLKNKYGSDAFVRVEMRVSKCPEVQFLPGKATFTAAVTTDLFITTRNDSKVYHETTATVDVSGSVKITIANGTLYGKITVENVAVHIDEEQSKKWEDKISKTIKEVVEKYVNGDLLFKGVPLKMPFGFGLAEPLIRFGKGTCQIQTGFDYVANVPVSNDEARKK